MDTEEGLNRVPEDDGLPTRMAAEPPPRPGGGAAYLPKYNWPIAQKLSVSQAV